MSTHDRGAFGQLLAEAKVLGEARGVRSLRWDVHFDRGDDDQFRWVAQCYERKSVTQADIISGNGRTGEEALRRLVEKLRIAHEEKST